MRGERFRRFSIVAPIFFPEQGGKMTVMFSTGLQILDALRHWDS
jgi:hypothetical protein